MAPSLESCHALVLNADYRPISYFPLSLWHWQDTVRAVFMERVNVLSQYDRTVRSPSCEMQLPSVISLKRYIQPARRPAFTRFNVFLRDSFRLPVLRQPRRAHLRSPGTALARRPHDLGERGRGVRDLQPAQGRPGIGGVPDVSAPDRPDSDRP